MIPDQVDIEKMQMQEHLEGHNNKPNYLCSYCIKNRLEKLDNTLIPATPSDTPGTKRE